MSKEPHWVSKVKLAPFSSVRASGVNGEVGGSTAQSDTDLEKCRGQPLQVGCLAYIEDVEVVGGIGGAVSQSRHATNDDELDAVAIEGLQELLI